MTTEHPLRDYAREKFQEFYPGKSIKPRNAELAVYNWAVTHTERNTILNKTKYESEEPSWENRLFRWRYKQRLLSVLFNLKNNPDMVKKINKIKATDFDNTKRIERPEDVLERRAKEREQRNVWYRRSWRWMTRQD